MFDVAAAGDRRSLARLLSWVEQGDAVGRAVAGLAYRSGSEAATVGITGAPGAGKSTLTAVLISAARAAGVAQIGVLAVDPSSPFSGGAILGDRIRMQAHALDPSVYVRSMATRGNLGGLALAVPESVRVLGAVGMPLVLVETVGVGQVEVDVAAATDTTVVVVNPRWGDAVQASKAGLLEIADLFVINKADLPGARETRRDLEQMLDLSPPVSWRPGCGRRSSGTRRTSSNRRSWAGDGGRASSTSCAGSSPSRSIPRSSACSGPGAWPISPTR
jgi:LAO/AO transport system kinase